MSTEIEVAKIKAAAKIRSAELRSQAELKKIEGKLQVAEIEKEAARITAEGNIAVAKFKAEQAILLEQEKARNRAEDNRRRRAADAAKDKMKRERDYLRHKQILRREEERTEQAKIFASRPRVFCGCW